MNIQKVKDEIKNTVKMYLARGPFGAYEVEEARQRPLFIIGAPGIGKSTLVLQICDNLCRFSDVLYVSGESLSIEVLAF